MGFERDAYLAGASYSTLVGALQERGVPYDTGKPWNKNMVARILEDRRYIGEGGFPQILKQEQFNASQVSKQERVPPRHQTPAQKELRRLCGSTPPSWVEGQVLGLLNGLIENPDMISCTADAEEESEVGALRRQLDDALHSPPVEEAQIRSMAVHLAVLRLNAIGVEEYVDRWMEYYNRDRCQWDLAKLSPDEYYRYITTGEYPDGMLPPWVK